MNKVLKHDRKAISPVIATIIIVAVAIVMSIAVAYWLMGLVPAFTRFEKLEIPIAQPEKTTTGFNITVRVKNTGTSDATIDIILINGKLDPSCNVSWHGGSGNLGNTSLGITIVAGDEKGLNITLPATYKSGQTVQITLQTAAGYQYTKSVVLP